MIARGDRSFRDMVGYINRNFGTDYTRSSLIGRAHRMGYKRPAPVARAATKQRNLSKKAEGKRWKAEPSAERKAEKKQIRASFVAKGTSKTSRDYRIHLPKLPEMSRSELRAMLSDAVRNTALMEVGI